MVKTVRISDGWCFYHLSGQDLVNLFKIDSCLHYDKIDLITQPSARYDASGNPVLSIYEKDISEEE